jgi:ABC-type transport system involved in cytochrome bd biosynthesis fused ATPase/permease subunit
MMRPDFADRDLFDQAAPFRWQQSRDLKLAMRATLCLGACLMISVALLSVYVVMTIA